ncbi:MAG TPA: hypothetical protein VJ647_02195 [Chitinophagaceae bacterium]|nr:hypothetical protein [Chitinophagaceae bacterium]
MNRDYAHFNTAVHLIENYKGDLPLKHYLQQYFSQNKKHGSKDRKQISHLCYSYYRMGHALKDKPVEERLKAATDSPVTVFPWKHLLSEGIDAEAFEQSFLQQPDLFVRIRPGKEETVLKKLEDNNIAYQQLLDTCLAFPNTTKIDAILDIDKEAVIQDYSSQRAGELLPFKIQDSKPDITSLWDCCAASGGKSIMAYDLLDKIELTVSDIRPSILHNLKERFKRAGIKSYRSFIADLTRPDIQLPDAQYDLIIADVPCSGSGTWARTPEQLYFFKEEKIAHYTTLQRAIVSKVIPALKPGGTLLYITCSVFQQENEQAAELIKNNFGLHPDIMELIKGYNNKADSMFVARFVNQL